MCHFSGLVIQILVIIRVRFWEASRTPPLNFFLGVPTPGPGEHTDMCVVFVSFVSDKMGGAVDRDSLSTFSYELPIGQLKCELNSNIIPIGKIQTGIFYHRALLFKVI